MSFLLNKKKLYNPSTNFREKEGKKKKKKGTLNEKKKQLCECKMALENLERRERKNERERE